MNHCLLIALRTAIQIRKLPAATIELRLATLLDRVRRRVRESLRPERVAWQDVRLF